MQRSFNYPFANIKTEQYDNEVVEENGFLPERQL